MTKRRLRCIINKQKTLTEGDDGMASSSILLYKIKFEQEYHIDERACGHFFRPLCIYSFYNLED